MMNIKHKNKSKTAVTEIIESRLVMTELCFKIVFSFL